MATVRSGLYIRRGAGGKVAIEDMAVSTGARFFVDSTQSDAADGSANGLSPDKPFATIDYALSKCTANAGDIIYLMPGHNEGFANAQLDIDVDGVSIIGIGRGAKRPRIDFDHANASIDVGASNVLIKNITLLPSITDVLIAIDVEAGETDVYIVDVEALPGEDGAGADDFAAVVEFKAGCNNGVVDGLKVRQHASGAGYIAGVRLKGASDNITVKNCDIHIIGAGVAAPINGDTTLSTNVRILNNTLQTDAEPGIELLTGTTGIIKDNDIVTDLATIDAAIVADGCFLFRNLYCETATETGTLIGTESADD